MSSPVLLLMGPRPVGKPTGLRHLAGDRRLQVTLDDPTLRALARDADVAGDTAKRWMAILKASFQVTLLEATQTNLTKRLVKQPMLYFLDTGCAPTSPRGPQPLRRGGRTRPRRSGVEAPVHPLTT